MDSLPSKVIELDARMNSVEHRAKNLENEVHDLRELTKAVAVTNTNVKQLSGSVEELHRDVKELKAVPANRWNSIVIAIATGAVGALLGAVISLVLK